MMACPPCRVQGSPPPQVGIPSYHGRVPHTAWISQCPTGQKACLRPTLSGWCQALFGYPSPIANYVTDPRSQVNPSANGYLRVSCLSQRTVRRPNVTCLFRTAVVTFKVPHLLKPRIVILRRRLSGRSLRYASLTGSHYNIPHAVMASQIACMSTLRSTMREVVLTMGVTM